MTNSSVSFPSNFTFKKAKPFARYLIENQLDFLTRRNLELLRYYNLPLLRFFSHLSEKELSALVRQDLLKFLHQVEDDTAISAADEEIEKWKNGLIENIGKADVQISDIFISYSIRRQIFIEILPSFTQEVNLMASIIIEFENFYLHLKDKAFQVYLSIHNETIYRKNEILSSIISHSLNGIAAFDNDLRFLEWNNAMEKMFKVSKEETEGKIVSDLFPEFVGSEMEAYFNRALKGEKVHLKDRYDEVNNLWFESYLVPLFDSSQTQFGLLNVMQDVTEVRNKERVLREQKEELASANEELMENMAQLEEYQQLVEEKQDLLEEAQSIAKLGTYEYHLERGQVIISDEVKKIFALPRETIVLSLQDFFGLFCSEDADMLEHQWEYSRKTSFEVKCELQILTSEKESKWVNFISQSVVQNKKVIKIRGIIQDITEKKLIELKILEEKHFIDSVTDTSPDVITIFDVKEKKNVYANKEIYDVLGYNEHEIRELRKQGMSAIRTLIHPDDLYLIGGLIEEMSSTTDDQKVKNLEYRILNKDGEYKWIAARYRVFKRDENGNVSHIIGVSRDITELRQAYIELNNTNEELVRTEEQLIEVNNELEKRVERRTNDLILVNEKLKNANTDLENFIYTASHDLKSPINNLEGLLNMLKKKLPEEIRQENMKVMNMMDSSIQRLVRTIGDLAEVSRLQNDLLESNGSISDVDEIFDEVIEDMKGLKDSKNAEIEISTEVKKVNFFPKNFRSLIYNLLSNALKYSHPDRKPEIKLSTYMEDDKVVLEVKDNGLGIPKDQQKRIFSFFNRYHYNYAEGSGIGLYIVKRIVDNSHSNIQLESVPDVGTTFRIVFNPSCTI